jgi:hypothetical protein
MIPDKPEWQQCKTFIYLIAGAVKSHREFHTCGFLSCSFFKNYRPGGAFSKKNIAST